jgi:hypothetical protein
VNDEVVIIMTKGVSTTGLSTSSTQGAVHDGRALEVGRLKGVEVSDDVLSEGRGRLVEEGTTSDGGDSRDGGMGREGVDEGLTDTARRTDDCDVGHGGQERREVERRVWRGGGSEGGGEGWARVGVGRRATTKGVKDGECDCNDQEGRQEREAHALNGDRDGA